MNNFTIDYINKEVHIEKGLICKKNKTKKLKRKNFLILGNAGTGKTRDFIKNKLYSMPVNKSLVLISDNNDCYNETKDLLNKNGYNVILIDFTSLSDNDVELIVKSKNNISNLDILRDIDFTILKSEKTALFIIQPCADNIFDSAITEIMNTMLTDITNSEGQLGVEIYIDDFNNLADMDLERALVCSRGCKVEYFFVTQTIEHINKHKNCDWILKCVENLVFFGGNDYETVYFIEQCAKKSHNNKIRNEKDIINLMNDNCVFVNDDYACVTPKLKLEDNIKKLYIYQ